MEREARIEKLMVERSALQLQLEGESGRRTALEKQLQALQLSGGGGGGGGGGGEMGGSGGYRIDMMPLLGVEHAAGGRRGDPSAQQASRSLTRLLHANVRRPRPALVHAAAAADDVIEFLDRSALTVGRQLRTHRPLRLGAIGYMALLHCWIVVLLVHMAPSLPAEPRAFEPSAELASRHRNHTRAARNRMDRF